MNRRIFLKALASITGAAVIPQTFTLSSMYTQANASIDYKLLNITDASIPDIMPQVINLYLYGGPSELAGNLSNIANIELNSQSKYTDFFPGILDPQAVGTNGSVTPSGFWGSNDTGNGTDNGRGAGGDDMQFLVDQGHMTVYRTMMKRKNDSQSHREGILMSQKGSLDIDFASGFGHKLAAIISENRTLFQAKTNLADGTAIPNVEELVMPFVSILDGDTRIFDKDGSTAVPLLFNGISLGSDLRNPFSRNTPNGTALQIEALETLAKQTTDQDTKDYSEVIEAFEQRAKLSDSMGAFTGVIDDGTPDRAPALVDAVDIAANGGSTVLDYPSTGIGRSLRAAVTLAVENPGTLFTTIGGALGGWDDHNNGVDEYPERMRDVFEALRVAMMHIKYAGLSPTPVNNLTRRTDNIIINVFGDFGRRVNLNTSLGWNHGNNQNLYTLGGSMPGLRTAAGSDALGKVVGTTVRVGQATDDRQFTEPAAGSYEFEPMSIAANIYKYFGVIAPANISDATPDPLTSYEDPENPGAFIDPGSPPIDETQT